MNTTTSTQLTNGTLVFSVRSEQEIEALKANWRSDPCWDIENTQGYEAWYDELLAYRQLIEAGEAKAERERVRIKTSKLGVNEMLLRYIERLESRIDELEQKIETLS